MSIQVVNWLLVKVFASCWPPGSKFLSPYT
jgi:hypothetical protein